MKLYNIVESLILESVNLDKIIDAIKNRYKVTIWYDGDEPNGKEYRGITPVCLGKSKAGNYVLRAWQEDGGSHRGFLGIRPLPSWRLFRVDKMYSFNIDRKNRQPIIATTAPPKYNPNGDKTMVSVTINAKFP
jgi:hypothetical protein